MTRKQFLALSAGTLASRIAFGQNRPKNVLLLLGDQHKPDALGIDGDPAARTPNLDALGGWAVCTSAVARPSGDGQARGLPHNDTS